MKSRAIRFLAFACFVGMLSPCVAKAANSAAFTTSLAPGVYYDQQAHAYLGKKDDRAALEMFELASYWGNKTSQYNVGLMYWNGRGTPVDKLRAVAWLGIAAEQHDPLADKTLQSAYAQLSSDDRTRANAIWQELDEKYGDKATALRVNRRFTEQKNGITGSHLGVVGNLDIYDGTFTRLLGNGNDFAAGMQQAHDDYVGAMYGNVNVGPAQNASPDAAPKDPPSSAEPPPPAKH
ncbi:MAG: sel1 repeat family protein [Proteobacteria bacterium]|nr:sel1 repeat family protein [Pseudomonadota bacterium]